MTMEQIVVWQRIANDFEALFAKIVSIGSWTAFAILVGGCVVCCFVGYRVFRPLLVMAGMVAGAVAAAVAINAWQGPGWAALASVGGASLGLAVGMLGHHVAVFLSCGTMVGLLAAAGTGGLVGEGSMWIVAASLGAVGGVGGVLLGRTGIVLTTAAGGAYMIVACLCRWLLPLWGEPRGDGLWTFPHGPALCLTLTVTLAMAGLCVQLFCTARAPKPADEAEVEDRPKKPATSRSRPRQHSSAARPATA